MPLCLAYSGVVSEFVVLESCIAGKQAWDVPAVYVEIAAALVGTEASESIGMLNIAASWTAATDGSRLVTDLFGSGRLIGDAETYDDPANSLLHLVIQRGKGIPLTLAVIAAEIGRRRGIPIDVIGMPGHVVVSDPTIDDLYFDPFHGGTRLDAHGCRGLYKRLTGLDNWSVDFLRPIDASQQVWRMLNNLKSIYRRSGDLLRLKKVMIARSRFPNLGIAEGREFARLMRDAN